MLQCYDQCSDCTSFRCLQLAFEDIQRNENYTQFVQATPFVEGTWDDHDYGLNDGGGSLPFKNAARDEFLTFLNVSKHTPRYKRDGVYSSHAFLIKGAVPQRGLVKVVLLDTRYFRDQPLLVHRLGQYNFPFSTYLAAALRFAYGLLGYAVVVKRMRNKRQRQK